MNAAIESRFWDRIADSYSKKPVPDEEAYRQTLDRVRERLSPTDRVLELGCGTGTSALKLSGCADDILATDVSQQMIQIAKDRARTQGVDNVRFAQATLETSWLKAESFDVVLAFNLIHLLDDLQTSMQRIYELTKPGGVFMSKTPCLSEMGVWLRGVIPVMQLVGKAPPVNYFTDQGLQRAITTAGFEILETGLYPANSKSRYIAARKAS